MPQEPDGRDFFAHEFTAHEENCEECGRSLQITQWRGRTLWRLNGLHVLTMRDKRCPDVGCPGRSRVCRAPEELTLAQKHDHLGLDVLFEIGELRLRDDLSFAAIHGRLKERGIDVTERTVSNAFMRFLALMRCRAGDTEKVRKKLRRRGGMVVLIDGVQFDEHSPVLYVVTDTLSHTTLFAERHEVRSAEALAPLLKRLKAMDVPILAFVTDKEKGLVPAIRNVFPDVPHQFCQLHFLKRCAEPLEKPLERLGKAVGDAAKKLRKLRRQLRDVKPAKSPTETKERRTADRLLLAAHAASKVAGRAPFDPPALKRHERMLKVSNAAERIAARGGAAP
jgi:transposase-like protein